MWVVVHLVPLRFFEHQSGSRGQSGELLLLPRSQYVTQMGVRRLNKSMGTSSLGRRVTQRASPRRRGNQEGEEQQQVGRPRDEQPLRVLHVRHQVPR